MKDKIIKIIVSGLSILSISIFGFQPSAFAKSAITVAPMTHSVLLTPGETYHGSFVLSNPKSSDETLYYATGVMPFYIGDDKRVEFSTNGDRNQIVNWITVENPTGSLAPNSSTNIYYTINVPDNTPAGGQYALIKVASVAKEDIENNDFSLNISVSYGVGYMIYGEIAGTTIRKGEIIDVSVPSFLFSGNITGTSSIKNSGNTHGTAKYIMQVYPLFSNEELYTNEENPGESTILPDRTMYHETSWGETPMFGIFNVVYTVEFEGVTEQVSKMVIKCPIWLLFIIIFIIAAIIIYFVMRAKSRKNSRKRIETE